MSGEIRDRLEKKEGVKITKVKQIQLVSSLEFCYCTTTTTTTTTTYVLPTPGLSNFVFFTYFPLNLSSVSPFRLFCEMFLFTYVSVD